MDFNNNMKIGKKGQSAIITGVIMGFVALYVGSMLVPQIWDAILGDPSVTTNGTTETFLGMVPWMSAIGLVVTAVSVFIVGARKRL